MSRNPYAPPNAHVQDPADPAEKAAPTARLYSPWQIAFGSFLGSPMAAAWLAGANFRAIGRPHDAKSALLVGVAATILVSVLAFVIPDSVPNAVFPVTYSVATHAIAKSIFATTIARHLSAGGSLGSSWRVLGVSLLFVVALLAVGFAVVLLLDQLGALPE